MKSRVAVIAAAMVIAACAMAQESGDLIEVRPVADFEGDDWARGWEVPGRERDDWSEAGETTLERSTEWASSGSASVKLTFDAWEKGEGEWRVINFRPGGVQAGDWRGWDALEFDAYLPNPEGERVQMHMLGGGVEDPNHHRLFSMSLYSGRWRVSLRTDRMRVPDPDLAKMDLIRFTTRQNRHSLVIHVDNMRLVNRQAERLDDVQSWLSVALELAPEDRREAVQALAGRAEELAEALEDADQPAERQQLRERIDALVAEARVALEALSERTLSDAVSNLVSIAAPAEEAEIVTSLDEPPEVPADTWVEAMEGVLAAVERQHAQADIQARMQRQAPDAPMAIGIPRAPVTLTEAPEDYDGPMRREVRIAAARHEYEPFQLVLFARERELTGVRVRASGLRGPGAIAPENVQVAPMGWREELESGVFIADMLRPDITRFAIPAGGLQPVWINVHVPRATPPGEYRGTITVSADGIKPQTVEVALTVWPFTLPKYASMPTAIHGWGHGGEQADRNAHFVIEHRLNSLSIYQWPDPPPLEQMLRWHEWGGNLFNLKRLSRMGSRFEEGPDGRLRFKEGVRRNYLRRVEKRMEQVEERAPWLAEHLMLYGFDELGSSLLPALEDMYGEFKRRYPSVRTMTTVNVPLWEDYETIEHLDIIAVVPGLLSHEVRDRLRSQGMEVWWYNLGADQRDEVRMRAQFWATVHDDLDGVLHWSLSAGSGAGPYGEGLKPEAGIRSEDGLRFTWGGLLRRAPDGRPLSTTALEYWREGLEDCDYLALLRERLQRARELPEGVRAEHRELLRRAEEMAAVPDYLTTGIMGADCEEELVPAVCEDRHTDDMQVILQTRERIAGLIVALDELLEAAE